MFLVALGCIWGLQGLGVLSWPADSFMLGDMGWALRGALTAAIGFALFYWAHRRSRR